MEAFENLPRRVFLDSCTVQTLRDYGGLVWEDEPLDPEDRIHRIPEGYANVEALRRIFRVNQRALFEWIVSENSVAEADRKNDPPHLQWVYDVLDHSAVCLSESGAATEQSEALARRLAEPRFNYLSQGDRLLIRDAVLFRCEAFLTMERRLARNAQHLQRVLGLPVLRPVDFWRLLEPWARLFL